MQDFIGGGNVLMPGNGMASSSVSAFGDSVSSQLNPVIAIKAVYGLLDDVETFTATGGSVTASESEFVCQTGTSAGAYATVWSKKQIVYFPGLACEARLTARFTNGIPDSTQLAGLFTVTDGMFFGFNGASFGVMHRYGGELEIRTITITAAAGGTETVTVTLNGTPYAVSVAASATVVEAAHDLEQALIASAANAAWQFQHIDDTIVCIFRGTGSKSGAYSVSSTGTLAGTVAQTQEGAAPTENWTAQANWNKSRAKWLDHTKGNLFKVAFAFLGYGPLMFSVMNPTSKQWELVHVIDWPNNNARTNLGNPSLRVGWASASLGSSGTNLTVAGASAMAALDGIPRDGVRSSAAYGENTSVSTETQILSTRVRREFGGRECQAVVIPSLSLATDATKGMIFRIYKNCAVAGNTNHKYIDQNQSVMLYDTAGTTVSGGRLLSAIVIGPSGSRNVGENDLGAFLVSGDEITVTGQVVTGGAGGGFVTIIHREIV